MRTLILTLALLAPAQALADVELPLDPAKLAQSCDSECLLTDAKGALLCLEGSEGIAGFDCQGVWIEPDATVVRGWKQLVDERGREATKLYKAAAAQLNKRVGTPVVALFQTEPFTKASAPQTLKSEGLTLLVGPEELVLETSGAKVRVAWSANAGLVDAEAVTAKIYRLGSGYLAALVIKDPNAIPQRTVWAVFEGAPTPATTGCPAEAHCPADYAQTRVYFDQLCRERLDEHELELEAKSHRVSMETLVALFNLPGAFYGYEFKREQWLNAFYYGNATWLPASCRAHIKRYTMPRDVPMGVRLHGSNVRTIWQSLK